MQQTIKRVGVSRLDKLPTPLKGPRLVDVVLDLIKQKQLSHAEVQRRYNVSASWLREMQKDPQRSPQCDVVQYMYEDLTGKPLLT